jgi:hypothetical protein
LFTERSSLNQTEPMQSSPPPPSSIDNLREIMSDLMLAASWSKRPTKIDEQSTNDDEEMVAESFISTEQHYPTSSLCEIVHEIENFPLSSSRKLSHPTIQIEERDTISPFNTETPIIIHRTILTRQETERWPQDEIMISNEQTQEDILTNEFEKTADDIPQHDEDWMSSSNQRKEIYGEQYRPERRFSKESSEQLITNDAPTLKSKQENEQRDEDELYPIERTWSTEKMLESPSTIEADQELKAQHESPYEVHQKLTTDETVTYSHY